jgi:tetratricopeptide (TPR) repeat protein
MKNLIFLLLLTMLTSKLSVANHNPDSSLNIIDKSLIAAKMLKAKDKFFAKDYRAAYILYREVVDDDPKNAVAYYYMAECHYGLLNYDVALQNMIKAEALNPKVSKDLDYLKGNLYLKMEKIDEAIEAYTRYKATLKETEIEEFEINELGSKSSSRFRSRRFRPGGIISACGLVT